jgi:magnesium chelatase family protein
MRRADALETTRIPRTAGLTSGRTAVVTTRLFRAPHQTISDMGVIGGGQRPMLGAVSLTHHGLLFVDELPECTRHVREVLRQPLEKGLTKIQFPVRHRPCYFGRAHPGPRANAASEETALR